MLERGVIVETGGREDAVIRFLPPLILEASDADRIVRDLRRRPARGGSRPPPRHHGGMSDPLFVTADPASHAALREAATTVVDALTRSLALPGPRSALSPAQLAAAVDAIDPCPEEGAPLERVLDDLAPVLDGSLRLGDPRTVAHLHPAPLISAAAAELAIGVTNQSMDAFDASPAATFVEDALVGWLAREHGLGARGSGVMTMGGTASNLLGLLLRARSRRRRRQKPRSAAQPLADRRVGGLARQHPPLGRAARARHRGRDRRRDRQHRRAVARSVRRGHRRRARDRGRRDRRDDRPRRDRPARRARRPRAAPAARGSTSTPPSARGWSSPRASARA